MGTNERVEVKKRKRRRNEIISVSKGGKTCSFFFLLPFFCYQQFLDEQGSRATGTALSIFKYIGMLTVSDENCLI